MQQKKNDEDSIEFNELFIHEIAVPKSEIDNIVKSSEAIFKEAIHQISLKHRNIENKAINDIEYKDEQFAVQLVEDYSKDDLISHLHSSNPHSFPLVMEKNFLS